MKNKSIEIFAALITIFVFSLSHPGQSAPLPADADKERARDIISRYKAATGFDKIQADVKLLGMEYERSYSIAQGGGKLSTIHKLNLSRDNEVRREYINGPGGLPTKFTAIWDRKTYYAKQYENGKITVDKKITLSKQEVANSEEVGDIYWLAFEMFFPITFEPPSWYPSFEFRYVGTAESPDGTKADVIETPLGGAAKYQFLFDQKTHLLLMWVVIPDGKGKREIYRYSDYKEDSGLLIPHKIETKGGNFDFTYAIKNVTASKVVKPEVFKIPEN